MHELFKLGHSRISLDFIHSGKGLKLFKTMSNRNKHRMSAFDHIQSRRLMGSAGRVRNLSK